MSITTHSGFRAALAESDLTAREALFIISSVEASERLLAGCSQSETICYRDQNTSPEARGSNPTPRDEFSRKYDEHVSRQEPSLPSQSSLVSPPYKIQDGKSYDLSGQKWSRS